MLYSTRRYTSLTAHIDDLEKVLQEVNAQVSPEPTSTDSPTKATRAKRPLRKITSYGMYVGVFNSFLLFVFLIKFHKLLAAN